MTADVAPSGYVRSHPVDRNACERTLSDSLTAHAVLGAVAQANRGPAAGQGVGRQVLEAHDLDQYGARAGPANRFSLLRRDRLPIRRDRRARVASVRRPRSDRATLPPSSAVATS